MTRTSMLLAVALIFAIAGIAATIMTHRPAPGGKAPQTTSGQSGTGGAIDPGSVGGPNDNRQPIK